MQYLHNHLKLFFSLKAFFGGNYEEQMRSTTLPIRNLQFFSNFSPLCISAFLKSLVKLFNFYPKMAQVILIFFLIILMVMSIFLSNWYFVKWVINQCWYTYLIFLFCVFLSSEDESNSLNFIKERERENQNVSLITSLAKEKMVTFFNDIKKWLLLLLL